MERFEEMCKDRLLGLGDYVIFEDWSAMIDRSRDGYIHIRDGLVLEGEVQEMNEEENFYDKEPYKARVCAFFLAYHQVCTIVGDSCSVQRTWSVILSSR
jgi:hypothetical protein